MYLRPMNGRGNPRLGSFINPDSHRNGLPRRGLACGPSCGCGRQELGGFFSSLTNFVKTTVSAPLRATAGLIQHGPQGAIAATKADFAAGLKSVSGVASIVVPIASLFPGVGTLVAAGVGLASSYYKASQAKVQAALMNAQGNAAELLRQYMPIAGTVPGRLIGVSNMLALMDYAFDNKAIPGATNGYWPNMAEDLAYSTGGHCNVVTKHTCPLGLKDVIASDSSLTAIAAVSKWATLWDVALPIVQNPLGGQMMIDLADALIAQANPNAPFSYAMPADQAPTADVPTYSPQPVPGGVPLASQPATVNGPPRAFIAPMTGVNIPPLGSQPTSIAAGEAQANAAAQALAGMQSRMDALQKQLSDAQAQGNSAGANLTAQQIAQLQQAQASTGAIYTQGVVASQPTQGLDASTVAGIVTRQLQDSGVAADGSVSAGVNAALAPQGQLFGLPTQTVLLGAGAIGLAFYLLRKRRGAR